MGTDIYGIGISALTSAKIGLATTQHNIANANTAGYNRQTIVTNARPAQLTGAGFVGQGADVNTIKRLYDEFLTGQVTQQQGRSSQLDAYYTQILQINNMIADPKAGLSPALQTFFDSVNAVSATPDSIPARQTMLSSSTALTSRFQSLNQQLVDLNNGVNAQLTTSVTTVNSFAVQIAALNQSIGLAQAASGGKPSNDLLDQRDQLISQLNQEINTTVLKQVDGSYSVTVGNGQLLVTEGTASSLQVVQSQSDPNKLEIASGTAGGAVIRLLQTSIQGGKIGGLLAFRTQSLDASQNSLGLIAMGVAGTFNQQHQLGMDLKGALAATSNSFFTDPAALVNKNTGNTGTAVASATISDFGQLTGSDYTLAFDGTSYTLTRQSDNTVSSYPSSAPAATIIDLTTTDGIKLTIPVGAVAGDSFVVRPTVNGAQSFGVNVTDPAKIAAAAPVLANATISNTGNGKITTGAVDATYTATTAATLPATLTYTSGVPNTLTGFPAALPVTVTSGGVATVFAAGAPVTYTDGASVSFGGISFTITGAPNSLDTFTVAQNSNSPSDNRNALAMAGLQIKNTMLGGTANYQGLYGQLVSQIGNKTRELEVTSLAQTALVNQSIKSQQAVSGVNLDEEAANLLRYQRAYQAAGKAMQIANTLFNSLLQLGR